MNVKVGVISGRTRQIYGSIAVLSLTCRYGGHLHVDGDDSTICHFYWKCADDCVLVLIPNIALISSIALEFVSASSYRIYYVSNIFQQTSWVPSSNLTQSPSNRQMTFTALFECQEVVENRLCFQWDQTFTLTNTWTRWGKWSRTPLNTKDRLRKWNQVFGDWICGKFA